MNLMLPSQVVYSMLTIDETRRQYSKPLKKISPCCISGKQGIRKRPGINNKNNFDGGLVRSQGRGVGYGGRGRGDLSCTHYGCRNQVQKSGQYTTPSVVVIASCKPG